jgi:DNA-directed RNA polymerase beta subunit
MEENKHSFLAEELLINNLDKNDVGRVHMFTSHITQSLVLNEPEKPRVFTNFENQIGEVTSSFKKADDNLRVIDILYRNHKNKVLIVETDAGLLDIIEINDSFNITENYGFNIEDLTKSKKPNDIIQKGSILYKSSAHDENLNFQYGTNLKAVYYSWLNKTFEDGIVISKSAAEKLKYTSVSEFFVSLNTNDILLNIHGDEEEYKCFPNIGERIKNKILCSRRRIDYKNVANFTSESLKEIKENDISFYIDGIVSDIIIYSNTKLENLKDKFNDQIIKKIEQQNLFHADLLCIINENKHLELTDEAKYILSKSEKNFSDEDWWYEGSFDHLVIKFVIKEEKKAVIGSKVSSRHGSKGVISDILDDHLMPYTEDGHAEIIMNVLGTINRLNLAVMYELEINYIVDEFLRKNKHLHYNEFLNKVIIFLSNINKQQGLYYEKFINNLNEQEKEDLVKEIYDDYLYIHQPPFYNNISFEELECLYDKYDVKPKQAYYIDKDEIVPIDQPLIMSDIYIIHLKHQPSSKLSARSVNNTNIKGTPAKSKEKKNHQSVISTTPIRLGEQELANMAAFSNDLKEVVSFLNFHSSNDLDRKALNDEILTYDGISPNDLENSPTSSAQVLHAYLQNIGLSLEHTGLEELDEISFLNKI